ncbi:enoyl-CoA hydratase [Prosthecomicrobium sp. N25]|uniref:enoyl-CoA hydratase n=1 Tax=Prosthecomicrobium sp. N25 TaxID=3129254 RepID=UPI003076C1F7
MTEILATDDPRIRAEVAGAVGRLLVDHPARRNAVSLAMWRAIPGAVRALEAHPDVRVILVAGAGDLAFVSGADISEFAEVRRDARSGAAYERANAEAFAAIRTAAKPTVAVIRGFCLGGGMGLAVACDLRIASEDAVFGIPAGRLGVGYPPDCMRDVVNAVGPMRAKELFFTARRVPAPEALAIGLLTRVVPAAELAGEAERLAAEIAGNAPLTLRAAKAAVGLVAGDPASADAASVLALTEACFDSEDFAEGRTAFLEKRAPVFRGR